MDEVMREDFRNCPESGEFSFNSATFPSSIRPACYLNWIADHFYAAKDFQAII